MIDDLEERRTLGYKVVREMFGDEFYSRFRAVAESEGFGSEAARMALEFALAENWGKPGLERKQRSIVTIGALIALGSVEELKNHIRAGLNNGLTTQEIEAIILQTIPYVGLALGAQAISAAIAVLEERGIDTLGAENRGTP